jgi:hypothetical protein
MSTIAHCKKLIASAAAATVAAGIAIPLAAIVLAGPAGASTHAFEPPDPCATTCGTVHAALNPQPLPPGRVQNPPPQPIRPGAST